jgi:GT2 family glycosyltransferase
MDITAVIINWNSKAYVRQCLRSLAEHRDDLEIEVIVLDNASHDGCGEMLAVEFPGARFIQSEKNLGFAGGNNMAAAQATASVLVFLNPDTEVRGGALRKLLEVIRSRPDAGAVGARLLNSDGTLQTSCIQAFPSVLGLFLDGNLLRGWAPRARLWGMAPLYDKGAGPFVVEGISGACIMTPRNAFEAVNGFSEEYFMYYEDMDYCLKVQKAGWRNYYVPEAEIVHHGGKSSASAQSAFSSVMMAESAQRFFKKEQGAFRAGLFRLTMAMKAFIRLGLLSGFYMITWPAARRHRIASACRKWISVFRWAFGAEKWAASYQQPPSDV